MPTVTPTPTPPTTLPETGFPLWQAVALGGLLILIVFGARRLRRA